MPELSLTDWFGHLFYAFIFAGHMLLARKNLFGWPTRLVGEVGWLILGVVLGLSSVWIWGVVFCVMDVYGFINWRKDAHATDCAR